MRTILMDVCCWLVGHARCGQMAEVTTDELTIVLKFGLDRPNNGAETQIFPKMAKVWVSGVLYCGPDKSINDKKAVNQFILTNLHSK